MSTGSLNMTTGTELIPATSHDRGTAIRQALLFLAICSPYILASRYVRAMPPGLAAVLLLGATLLFLQRERRSPAVLGLEGSWRRVGEFAAGLGGGALLLLGMAFCVRLLLPFPWR